MNTFDDTYSDILDCVTTESDTDELVNNIDLFLDSLYRTEYTLEDNLDRFFSYQEKKKLLTMCKKNNIDLNENKSVQLFFEKIKKGLSNIPVVTIKLAFDPNERQLTMISSWLFSHLQKRILINVEVEQSIIGGAVICYKGRYGDYSLEKEIQKYYHEQLFSLS